MDDQTQVQVFYVYCFSLRLQDILQGRFLESYSSDTFNTQSDTNTSAELMSRSMLLMLLQQLIQPHQYQEDFLRRL